MTTDKMERNTEVITVAEGVMLVVDHNAPKHFVPWQSIQKCGCGTEWILYSTMRKESVKKWALCPGCFNAKQSEKRQKNLPEPVLAAWLKARAS